MTLIFFHLGLLFISLVAGLLATRGARSLALRIGMVDNPGERKIHSSAIPYGGGIAIYCVTIGIILAAGAAALFVDWKTVWPQFGDVLAPYVDGLRMKGTLLRIAAVLGGATIVFLLGVYDDLRGLMPKPKLIIQTIAALLLVAADVRITVFVDNLFISATVTVLWVVLVTNAFNLLDNMDGLSAGVANIASMLLFIIALTGGQMFVAAFLAVFSGALMGFLYYNFPFEKNTLPGKKIFMGDAGSLFIGFILAALSITGTYYQGGGSVYSVFMPLLVLGVPLFDTATVMWIRFRAGKPLFLGDTNHFSHRLVRLGMSRRGAVLTIYLLGLILGGMATLLRELNIIGTVTVFLLALGLLALIGLLELAARNSDSNDNREEAK